MAIVVRNIVLSLDESEESILSRVATRLKLPESAIGRFAIVRRSLDARRGRRLSLVYSVELSLQEGVEAERRCVQRLSGRNVAIIDVRHVPIPEPGVEPLRDRPVVVGFGPAGMFAALRLAQYGYQPIVFERGKDVRMRHRDVLHTFYREGKFNRESNLLFGEGGAGTYSDGKVYSRISSAEVRDVLGILCRFGANPDVLIDGKPHIGSDRLPTICRRIRLEIERLGGQVLFEKRVEVFEAANGVLSSLVVNGDRVSANPVLLGIGHSASDTYHALHEGGVSLEAKPFQFGVRIEHPQDLVNRWQYGSAAGDSRLPAADYQLIAKNACSPGRDLFSFCMCPGGAILPCNENDGLIVTNGASRSSRRGLFANSGFVVSVDPAEYGGDPLAGLAFQRKWEALAFAETGGTYRVPIQRCNDLLAGRTSDGAILNSHPIGASWCKLAGMLPQFVTTALMRGLPMLEKQLVGFSGSDGVIAAPESRASSPVRIVRDRQSMESVNMSGLYPMGEGAGYAGGIVSAAADGMRVAARIISRYRPVN